jgi:hypothetical protein
MNIDRYDTPEEKHKPQNENNENKLRRLSVIKLHAGA